MDFRIESGYRRKRSKILKNRIQLDWQLIYSWLPTAFSLLSFSVLSVVNWGAIHMGMQLNLSCADFIFFFFGFIPKWEIAENFSDFCFLTWDWLHLQLACGIREVLGHVSVCWLLCSVFIHLWFASHSLLC